MDRKAQKDPIFAKEVQKHPFFVKKAQKDPTFAKEAQKHPIFVREAQKHPIINVENMCSILRLYLEAKFNIEREGNIGKKFSKKS